MQRCGDLRGGTARAAVQQRDLAEEMASASVLHHDAFTRGVDDEYLDFTFDHDEQRVSRISGVKDHRLRGRVQLFDALGQRLERGDVERSKERNVREKLSPCRHSRSVTHLHDAGPTDCCASLALLPRPTWERQRLNAPAACGCRM